MVSLNDLLGGQRAPQRRPATRRTGTRKPSTGKCPKCKCAPCKCPKGKSQAAKTASADDRSREVYQSLKDAARSVSKRSDSRAAALRGRINALADQQEALDDSTVSASVRRTRQAAITRSVNSLREDIDDYTAYERGSKARKSTSADVKKLTSEPERKSMADSSTPAFPIIQKASMDIREHNDPKADKLKRELEDLVVEDGNIRYQELTPSERKRRSDRLYARAVAAQGKVKDYKTGGSTTSRGRGGRGRFGVFRR